MSFAVHIPCINLKEKLVSPIGQEAQWDLGRSF